LTCIALQAQPGSCGTDEKSPAKLAGLSKLFVKAT
jgi:hypothetical protein